MQQGELFSKQHQLFSVVEMGPSSLLTVDLDVETSIPGVPALMVKKLVNDAPGITSRATSRPAPNNCRSGAGIFGRLRRCAPPGSGVR